jgi:N-hydroxyarylamine O-acetyltransferase
MFLTVPLAEGTFIVDPGFGGHGPRTPVPLVEGAEVRVGCDVHGVSLSSGEWVLHAQLQGSMAPLWMSTLEAEHPIDFEMANHFTSTFPGSRFVRQLTLRALTDRGRVSVLNREVTRAYDGSVTKEQLADRKALRALLVSSFGFDLPEVEQLRIPSVAEWVS